MGFWKEWWGELGRRNRAPAWPVGAPVTTWSGARPTAPPLLIQGCQGTWRVEDPAPKPAVTTKLPSSMRGSGFCLCQLKCTHFYSYLNLASTGLNSPWSKRRNRSQGSCQKPQREVGIALGPCPGASIMAPRHRCPCLPALNSGLSKMLSARPCYHFCSGGHASTSKQVFGPLGKTDLWKSEFAQQINYSLFFC